MQQIKINNVEYNIPITWDDLTYKQAIGVIKNVDDKGKQLSEITGIPYELILSLADQQASILFELISFTENLEVFDNDIVKDDYKDFDFGSIEYGIAEKCRQHMKTGLTGFEVVIDIIKTLKGVDITNEPFMEWIGTANFFLSKSITSMIATPSLTKLQLHLNSNKLELTDYKSLAHLERMLKSQEVDH